MSANAFLTRRGPSTFEQNPAPFFEYPIIKDPPSVFFPNPETVVKHLMIDNMFNHIDRDNGIIQDRVDSYDFPFPAIASEPYGPPPGPLSAIPPGNPTRYPVLKIFPIQAFEGLLKMIMATFGHDVGLPEFRGPGGSFDFSLVGFYIGAEGPCDTVWIPP